eukprot:SAG25_NODE_6_length_29267_cov_21.188803_33_plen_131_part_00
MLLRGVATAQHSTVSQHSVPHYSIGCVVWGLGGRRGGRVAGWLHGCWLLLAGRVLGCVLAAFCLLFARDHSTMASSPRCMAEVAPTTIDNRQSGRQKPKKGGIYVKRVEKTAPVKRVRFCPCKEGSILPL